VPTAPLFPAIFQAFAASSVHTAIDIHLALLPTPENFVAFPAITFGIGHTSS